MKETSSTPDASKDGSERNAFWAVWATVAAFGTYFCMFGFRKPFTAAPFDESRLGGLDFKTLLVIAQVLGYMTAKFVGIKIIAELPPERRTRSLVALMVWAEGSLVLFAVLPRPWNVVCFFLNGYPLGMVFGIVLGFLEGRRLTEALAAGLCTSFILADGVAKSLGASLLEWGFEERWMPSVAGLVAAAPMGLFIAMLSRTPGPDARDIAARTRRVTMPADLRAAFLRRYAGGLIPLIAMYLLVTIARGLRGDFAPELWRGLGEPAAPATFTHSEILVAMGVLAASGGAVLFRDNRRAFAASLGTCAVGFACVLIAVAARATAGIGAFPFMVLVGLGLYLPYVAVHTTLFERLIAMTREPGNLGFLMYTADSVGYLGYVAVMLARAARPGTTDFATFFLVVCAGTALLSIACLLLGGRSLLRHPAGLNHSSTRCRHASHIGP
ncbi:MAG: hypothetical protein FJ297_11495 [Planctomycetes bacterium]|nr:hypothetical protein [Planctomycetota bacterium]